MEDLATNRSIVGALRHVTTTRLEVGYAFYKVCPFVVQPLKNHSIDISNEGFWIMV